jgi:hypothetical protein
MGNYIYKISFIQKKSGKHNKFVLDNSSNFPNNPLKPDCAPSPKLWRRRKGTCPVNHDFQDEYDYEEKRETTFINSLPFRK